MSQRVAFAAAVAFSAGAGYLACADDPAPATASSGSGVGAMTSSAGSGGADRDAGADVLFVDAEAPAEGWERWSWPEPDCAVFVPSDVSKLPSLAWEACPFMARGCKRLPAPWAATTGWGYGRLLAVAERDGVEYLSFTKRDPADWWQAVLYRQSEPLGAWAHHASEGTCSVSGPWFSPDGNAGLEILPFAVANAPYVGIGEPDGLFPEPPSRESFVPPDAAVIPSGFISHSDRILAVHGYYGNLAVRDRVTGATDRPQPFDVAAASYHRAVVVGDDVFFLAYTGARSSIWVRHVDGSTEALLEDGVHSFDEFSTDGTDAVWTRSEGQLGTNEFATIELWTSPIAPTPAGLSAKQLMVVPQTAIPYISVGSGWVSVQLGPDDIRLIRIRDGATRRLPSVPGLAWNAIHHHGITITASAVWVQAYLVPGAGNDVRFITRFDIDALPEAPLP